MRARGCVWAAAAALLALQAAGARRRADQDFEFDDAERDASTVGLVLSPSSAALLVKGRAVSPPSLTLSLCAGGGRRAAAAEVHLRPAQPAVPRAGVQEARDVPPAGRLHRALRRQAGRAARGGRRARRGRRVLRRRRAVRGVRRGGARAVPVRLRQPHLLVAVPPRPAQLRAPRRAARDAGVPRVLSLPRARAGVRGGAHGRPPAGLVLRADGGRARRAAARRRLPAGLQGRGALDVRAPGRGRRRAAVARGAVRAAARRARALPAALPGGVRARRAVPRRVVRVPAARRAPVRRAGAGGARARRRRLGARVRRARLLPPAPVPRRARRVLVRGRARAGARRLPHQGRAALRRRAARRRGRRAQRGRPAALLAPGRPIPGFGSSLAG